MLSLKTFRVTRMILEMVAQPSAAPGCMGLPFEVTFSLIKISPILFSQH